MRINGFQQRKNRVRAKVSGESNYPRLSVFRSNKSINAQLIDDVSGVTLVSVSSKEVKEKGAKTEISFKTGELLAKKAIAAKLEKARFDKSGYKYHGRVAAVADGARKGGLII